jgi:photosystem II stability/assembly factor-like uncharacterized protein
MIAKTASVHLQMLRILLVQVLLLFIQQLGFSGSGDWQLTGFQGNASSFAIDPSDPKTMYATDSSGSGYFKSSNSGKSWIQMNMDSYLRALCVNPRNSNEIIAAEFSQILLTRDGGHSWFQIALTFQIGQISSFQYDPIDSNTIYAVAQSGIAKSTDGGITWNELNTAPIRSSISGWALYIIKSFAIDPRNTNVLYAGGGSYGLWKTTNGGATWMQQYQVSSSEEVTSLAINPKNPSILYLGTNRKLLKTSDAGSSWQPLISNNASVGGTLAIDPLHPDILYAGGAPLAYRSNDAGQTWTDIGGEVFFYHSLWQLVIDPQNPAIVYARTTEGILVYGSPVLMIPPLELSLTAGGAATACTSGLGAIRTGYAGVQVNSGATPYGTAVFSFSQDGIVVSEAAVPASPPIKSARIFIDYRSAVSAVPGRSEAGTIDVNTGIAVVNNGNAMANVTYILRDLYGGVRAIGQGTVATGSHFAKFIDKLKDEAFDFNLPSDFRNAIQFGSLEMTSDQPISILALRGTTNQRNEFLITTTPTADLDQPLSYNPIFFPQFADGGGYTTSLILLNTSNVRETGRFEIRDKDGNFLTVNQVGGTNDYSFPYSIEPGGLFRFQTDGSPINTKAGWVRLIPDAGVPAPIGSGVFSFNPHMVLVSESGIPTAAATTHARVYVDLSENHNTGLAIANVSSTSSTVVVNAFQKDGVTIAGNSKQQDPLPANGYTASFADGFVTGLPTGFTGVLDISSSVPFAALTLRSLDNERGDFLMTTFPVADANQLAPSPIVFPQIADGGGYRTQILLLSPGGNASTMFRLYDETGIPMDIAP